LKALTGVVLVNDKLRTAQPAAQRQQPAGQSGLFQVIETVPNSEVTTKTGTRSALN
jgi:hypothetical protein